MDREFAIFAAVVWAIVAVTAYVASPPKPKADPSFEQFCQKLNGTPKRYGDTFVCNVEPRSVM